MVFPVAIYGCESWTIKKAEGVKNWCFWTVVLEKTLESPLDCKGIKLDNPKGNQSWILIRRTDAETEAPILWSPDAKNQLIRKDPDAGKDWRQEEKGTTKDEMVGQHHWLNKHEFEQGPGDGEGRTGKPGVLQSMESQSQTQLGDWTPATINSSSQHLFSTYPTPTLVCIIEIILTKCYLTPF